MEMNFFKSNGNYYDQFNYLQTIPWIAFDQYSYFNMGLIHQIPSLQIQQINSLQNQVELNQPNFSESSQKHPQTDRQGERAAQYDRKALELQFSGRNNYSNILKAFFNALKNNLKMKKYVESIIRRKDLHVTQQQFYGKLKRKFVRGKNYISPKHIIDYINEANNSNIQSQNSFCLLFRIVLNTFLKSEYTLSLIKSFKGKKQSRRQIVAKSRQLNALIFDKIRSKANDF